MLLLVGVGLESTMKSLPSVTPATASTVIAGRAAARHGFAALALLVVVATGCLQWKYKPYALRVQNRLARWLFISNALLVLLGWVCTVIAEYDTGNGAPVLEGWIEALLITLVLLDVILSIGAAVYVLIRERQQERTANSLDLSAVLLTAIDPIDAPLQDRLLDGSVRLLRASWLASEASNAELGRNEATGDVVLKRQQELHEEAFVPCKEAAKMLDYIDRSILVVSHGWVRIPYCPTPIQE
jgi:hypothetical protein